MVVEAAAAAVAAAVAVVMGSEVLCSISAGTEKMDTYSSVLSKREVLGYGAA